MNIPNVKAPVIEARLSHQASRIEQGIKSGELTAKEAKALVSQQKEIYKDFYQAKKDNGFVGPHERRELRHELNQASRDIFLAKHNDVER
jgi:phage-related minor tail protein